MKETKRIAITIATAGCLLSGAAQAAPVEFTIQPGPEGKDTYIDNRGPHTILNYDGEPNIVFGHSDGSNANVSSALIQFDLTGSPITSVLSATLKLYSPGTGGGTPMSVALRTIGAAWDESTVTWNTQPAINGAAPSTTFLMTDTVGWVSIDITAIYTGWVSGAFANYGLMFDGSSGTNNGESFVFRSSDYLSDPSLRPMLVVSYDSDVPEPETLALLGIGLTGLALSRRKRSSAWIC